MNAATLKALYETLCLEPPASVGVDHRGTRAMLRASHEMVPGELHEDDHPAVWVWSDLHLVPAERSIGFFFRPFGSAEQMDNVLFHGWGRTVEPDDVIVCLGDVTVHGLSGRRLKHVRGAPGRRVLVIGNHDVRLIGPAWSSS